MKRLTKFSILLSFSILALSCSKQQNASAATSTPSQQLNDTGITWGANYPRGNNKDCSAKLINDPSQKQLTPITNILEQQDCKIGRDTISKNGNGFAYKKVGPKGEYLEPNAKTWSCVLDSISGLLWENKKNPNESSPIELHGADDIFTWYSGNIKANGGHIGDWNSEFAKCIGYKNDQPETFCNINAFVDRVNNEGLCGFTDWRVPTRQELESIINYGRAMPSINEDYFPYTKSEYYWSQSPSAENNKTAWVINFRLGHSETQLRSNPQRVRLVRNATPHTP
jgi:hypothetical protein